ncbi:protocadherin-23 isoform X1 [Manacus candei]|uniref:protocadherin-23 isoform X1 n=1 Tax=Manacus candei TaxID=415023 RepID=UPI002227A528|nr:protocadherin-23 isoform X1 [Manacus candei]
MARRLRGSRCRGERGSAPPTGPTRALALLVLLWLYAAGGSTAPVYNLSLAVDEGLPAETLVGDIRAGLPAGAEAPGGFLLSEGSGESAVLADFHVQPETGIIRTARRLDRERRARYSFAAATLRGEVVQVEIAVTDVNDHPPRFPGDSLQLNVSELSPPGTAFRLPAARDPDAGRFGTQGYALLEEGGAAGEPPLFQLRYGRPEPLELVLLRRLDRERAEVHRLVVEAWDGGSPRRRGRLRVSVRVLDENDNAPTFSRGEYRARLREDAPPGTAVCRLRATDPDLGANGEVRYAINRRQSDPDGYFTVEERSGVLRLRRPLDREARALHRLVVEARDGGAQPEVSSVLVSVAVLDVNDNRPAIRLLYLTESGGPRVSEGARPGDYVARVSVSDADEDGEAEGGGGIALALLGGDGAFALRAAGAGVFFLCVAGPLDRESRDLYELRLVATDGGTPPLSAEEPLLLRVADLNDEAPAFPQPHYRATVSEAASPGTAVLRLSASDADEPGSPNAEVRYALEGDPAALALLRIDARSGAVSTRARLDRERQAALELRVVARDGGVPARAAACRLSVRVEDANDNEPRFERPVYRARLPEHAAPGRPLVQVKATDADADQFGEIEYSLYDGFHFYEKSKAFQIDPRTGQICVSQDIDREEDPTTYDLLVKATDGGGLSAQAFVRIEIEDINDNQPIFEQDIYVTSISSHTQPGTEVINVVATDRDSGIYGLVTYELVPGEFSSFFTVDTSTGTIYLVSVLGHLAHSALFLTVSARDGGGLPSATNAAVTVNILQTVLAPAIFERSRYTFSVPEGAPEDSLLGTVKAREPPNSLEVVSYRISSGDPHGKFSIDPQFGIIRTKKQLDHETQSAVVLTIQSQLGNSPVYSSTQVNISVIDINDNPPVFLTKSDKVTISHTQPPGTAVYIAHAEDKDSGLNGAIKYSIASKQSNAFSIDPSLGVVNLTRTVFADKQQEYTLHIAAEDCGSPPLTSLLMLTVVIEEQKMGPTLVFQNLVYQVEVSEATSPGARILQVQAHLLDPHSVTSNLTYFLEPSTDSVAFGISSDTGWIYLRKHLNYECAQILSFRALVSTSEDENLRQNASTSVIVNVLDENDNSPMFMHESYFFEIEENPIPRGVVGTITAVDRDSGRNGQLSYFLLSDGKYFKMNSNTGEIINWVALDREKQAHHQLSVLVTDQGSPQRSATAAVYIAVRDRNDHAPRFPRPALRIQVLEGQPSGTLVTTIFAKDFDSGNNGVVLYSVESEEDIGYFQIDAVSGELRTTRSLSHAERSDYRMMITARDQGMPSLQGHATVYIQVIPLPNGRSGFSQDFKHFVVPENFKPAQVLDSLKWPDNHLAINRKLHFSIAKDDDSVHFEIDSLTGDLFLSKELDYETASHFLLQVIVKDYNNNPPQNNTVFISVDIEDKNDHSPSFQDDFVVIGIEENVPVGTPVYTFNAKDGDGSFLNSKIQYSLETSNMGENPFLIHPLYGTLTTASPLDREITDSVIFTVSASDQAINLTDRRLDSLAVKIIILDVNDNSPNFTSSSLSYVMEDAEVGFLVHHIIAKDPDEGRNGQVTYYILSGNENKAFVLDKITGLLTTAQLLDREIQERYSLTVMALDDGSPALSATQVLTIIVLDVNDEIPIFTKQFYETAVHENQDPGEFVIKVEAVDRDAGLNSLLWYKILPGIGYEKFKMNLSSGELVTTASLDRETQEVFSIKVLVQDSGTPSLSSTVTVICTVLDENDHSPMFLFPASEIWIPENQQPSVVYISQAVDMDAGNNGALRYKIIGGNVGGYFTLNHTSGKLLVTRGLDREDISNFTLVIECHDLGSPSRSSTAQLYLTVLDENDHSPLFAKPQYQISVREDLEEGSAILDLYASDEDDGLNGEVLYSLIDNTFGAFAIDSVTGSIVTTKALDRETKSHYTFRVVASDCSTHLPRSTTVSVVVHIEDVNDNDPIFLQNPIRAFVPAETPVNEIVATVRAEDVDLGSNGAIVFNLMIAETVFQIDVKTGDIILQEPLASKDFSTQLLVTASDQGISPRTATAKIIIFTEEQEEEISFSHSLYEASVPENSAAGTSLLTVEAYEHKFTGEDIKYSIFSDKESIFSIHPTTGTITVKEPKFLDYEVKCKIHLTVLAENSLNSALCGVTVLIQDVNDNVPKFEQSYYKASVWEGQSPKMDIVQVFATDLDSGLNGEMEYSILSGNENATFLIDSARGILATNTGLDHENTSSYRLVVQAADKGNPRLSATSIVRIEVLDVNDNAPVFQLLGEVEVPENAQPGFIVTQVSASDADSRPALQFGFIYDNGPGMKFTIDQHTGVVTVVEPLDFEETAVYKLKIIVSDSVHQTEAELTILVLDINDNPPVFTQDSYQVNLPELISMDATVLTVSATDRDSGHNGMISYKILSSSEGFSIDHKNGSVFATGPVTELKNISTIHLLIEAMDGGSPALTAVTSIAVHIEDVNNYAPQFTKVLYNLSVSEDASVGESVLMFSAIDYDWTHENTYVEYSIIEGNAENLFSIETSVMGSETSYKLVGSLVLSDVLDRETASSHHLVLLASDCGTPSLNSTATVLITVLDVNDNAPVFSSPEYHVHVKESIPIGSHVTEVSANDCDAGTNAEITYAIISGDDRGHFRLDEKTGSMDLMKMLDYEDTMKFTLIIQATDGGADIKNMAFAVVFVNVLDDNDYAPLFLFPSLSCIVSENMPTFSFVCAVCALDFDKGSYGHITYSIQSSCLAHREAPRDHDMFFIDPLTGDIHTKQMFDYESQNRYCLIIQAKDKGDSLATITVQVDIEGRDEFDPVFTQEHYFFNLPEKNEAGQLLGRVTASDSDGGLDGVVHYSLLKPSPFFSVNETSGNIYLTHTVHRKKNGIKKNDDSLELLVRAHSPKMESKFTICTVFVNVSSSPDIDLTASAHSLTISVSISSIVFLLLVVGLIALTLRHKRKDLMNACVKKEAVSSSATDVNSAREDKDCQKIQSTESSMLPMGAIAKWLSLARIGEGKDDDVPCRHSDSSGHGSAEGETAEDEEIKRINEYPCRKNTSSALSEYGSRMPDSGIPRESDQFSYQSGEMDGMATMQSTENMQTIKGEGREEACDTAYAHEILSQTLKKIGIKEKGIMTDLTRECVPMSDRQDSGCDSLAAVGTSDEDLAGSYNRDYVLSWEPRFQSLASVFNDIAELKDENVHIHSLPKEKKSLVFPPPLITSVAQPGIRTVPPRMPNITSRQAFNKYAHSPIIHNLGYPPPTMTPSFSPSLSLLTMQTPTASPVVSDGKMIGTCLIDPSYELAMEEEIQV